MEPKESIWEVVWHSRRLYNCSLVDGSEFEKDYRSKVSWSARPSIDELKIVLPITTLCRAFYLLVLDLLIFFYFFYFHFLIRLKLQATKLSFFLDE